MNTLAKGLTAVALVVAAGYLFNLYKRYPVDSFCSHVPASATSQEIVSLADTAGLWVNPLDDNKDSVWVFNQRAPWWRYACIIDLQNGHASGKQVIAAD